MPFMTLTNVLLSGFKIVRHFICFCSYIWHTFQIEQLLAGTRECPWMTLHPTSRFSASQFTNASW